MANTYTQLYFQLVFATKGRFPAIKDDNKDLIEKYICGIIRKRNCKVLAIYCNPDHIHIFIGLNPQVSIANLARDIKTNSTWWINENKFFAFQFSWQEGYGAFSYSNSQINSVVKYILDQEKHHHKKSFKEEYLNILDKSKIRYNPKYLFLWND